MERLEPGLAGEEMDALTAPLGLRLPTEARLWWGWHDGVAASQVRYEHEREAAPGWPYFPLEESIARCRQWREISREWAEGAPGAEPPPWWGAS